jgi:hypothetical protein
MVQISASTTAAILDLPQYVEKNPENQSGLDRLPLFVSNA